MSALSTESTEQIPLGTGHWAQMWVTEENIKFCSCPLKVPASGQSMNNPIKVAKTTRLHGWVGVSEAGARIQRSLLQQLLLLTPSSLRSLEFATQQSIASESLHQQFPPCISWPTYIHESTQ